jgi:uncharacterized protein (TIGR03435 family)
MRHEPSRRAAIQSNALRLFLLAVLSCTAVFAQSDLGNSTPAITSGPQVASAMSSADAALEFDVATIKPSNPSTPGKQFMAKGHQFITINTTLNDMITFAYGVHTREIAGGPGWMQSEKYDLDGKFAGVADPDDRQWTRMIQRLLTDRFKLTFHREPRELSVFVLTVGKDGPKLKKSEADPTSLPGIGFRGFGNMPVSNATMADFAAMMQGAVLDRPMIDRTGLSGRFDFVLQWTPDDSQFPGLRPPGATLPAGDTPGAPPDLFRAVQEQLGLKLDATKAPVEVLIIDHVERPSAN